MPPRLPFGIALPQHLHLQMCARRLIELLLQHLNPVVQGISSGTFGVPIRLRLVPRRLGVFQPRLCDTSIRVNLVCPPLRHQHLGPGGIEIALHDIDPIAQPVGARLFLGESPRGLSVSHHQRGVQLVDLRP